MSIREWLPLNRKLSLQDLHLCDLDNFQISHFQHKCTKFLFYALSNIVCNGDIIVENMVIGTDIFRATVAISANVPLGCL